MGFSENLQIARKMKHMSQEQLAEKLDVSRQAVSKWESGNGYPEMDKLISICNIFDCTMDELMNGKISSNIGVEKDAYETLMNQFSKGIALGVGIILLGVTILLYLVGQSDKEQVQEMLAMKGVVVLLVCVLIAVPIFIILGLRQEDFSKKNPSLPNFYKQEEVDAFHLRFQKVIAGCVSLILLGVVLLVACYGFDIVNENSLSPVVILMICVMIAVPICIYYGIQKSKYDMEGYNHQHDEAYKKQRDTKEKASAIIMLIATIIFFVSGIVFHMWHINWIVYPVGGMLCGIINIIFENN